MAAENCEIICLLGAMDCLWFHQVILFSKNSLFPAGPEIPKPSLPISESPHYSSRNSSQESQLSSDQETSPVASVIITCSQLKDEACSSFQESDHDKLETTMVHDHEERPNRSYLVPSKTGSYSSSPVSGARKQSRNLGHSGFRARRLQKSTSCKGLGELELEEVKGFMDLGFTFKRENLSKRVMNLVPGLQRIDSSCNNIKERDSSSSDRFGFTSNPDNVEDEEEKKEVIRPYLSEAWLIKRPDSPLLNLRTPRVSTNEDMKKHLKDWARAVASAIHQDS